MRLAAARFVTMHSAATRTIRLLDNSRALSDAMAEVLVAHHEGDPFDFACTMVLVPGGRLARALERNLLARAKAAGVPLIAPSIVTPLMFAGRFVVPKTTVLSPLAARLSWREVLEASRAAGHGPDGGFELEVARVFGAATAIDARSRMRIAQRMQRLSSEVSAAMTDFAAVAGAECVRRRPDVAARLATLAEFAARRRKLLESAKAVDRDDAIRDAVRSGSIHAGGIRRIVVLLADPERVQRELLVKLQEAGVRVEVCVHSTDDIDDEGFPVQSAWEARAFPSALVPSSCIVVGEGPSESAHAAVAAIREMSSAAGRAITSAELAIMAPDAETSRELERELALAGSPASAVESRSFSATRLGTLLARLADLVGDGSAEALAAFVRHDDVAAWLEDLHGVRAAGSTVTEYRAETLVGAWRDEVPGEPGDHPRFRTIQSAIRGLVHVLDAPRPAAEWGEAIRTVVKAVVRETMRGAFAGEREGSIKLLDRALRELAEVSKEFATNLTCDEAIGLALESVGGTEVRGDRAIDGVSIIGWLDAGMADEPFLVLAGFSDGTVPQGAVTDATLPDEVRRELRLPSGQRFAARDAWILDGILARVRARCDANMSAPMASPIAAHAIFVVPRRNAQGDPLKPSRFLLRVSDAELPARVSKLFPTETTESRPTVSGSGSGTADFQVTPPVPDAVIEAVSVTAFKTYIECPYLFQLRTDRRLRLSSRDERAVELDALGFGSLVHAALEGWGREELGSGHRNEDAESIEASLMHHLDKHVAAHHRTSGAPALRVQVEIARRRLRRFARLQAEQAREGWRLHAIELAFDPDARDGAVQSPRYPDANGLFISGRIDRVDVLDGEERFRALDYKSSSSGDSPTKAHLKKRRGVRSWDKADWIDLQLPLYRVLLRSLGKPFFPAPLFVHPSDLGYINLAPSDLKSGFTFLEVDEAKLDEAEAKAAEIVANIRAGKFEPSPGIPLYDDDPLGPIWGVGTRAAMEAVKDAALSGADGDADEGGEE